jgi:hypothetical protein
MERLESWETKFSKVKQDLNQDLPDSNTPVLNDYHTMLFYFLFPLITQQIHLMQLVFTKYGKNMQLMHSLLQGSILLRTVSRLFFLFVSLTFINVYTITFANIEVIPIWLFCFMSHTLLKQYIYIWFYYLFKHIKFYNICF